MDPSTDYPSRPSSTASPANSCKPAPIRRAAAAGTTARLPTALERRGRLATLQSWETAVRR